MCVEIKLLATILGCIFIIFALVTDGPMDEEGGRDIGPLSKEVNL